MLPRDLASAITVASVSRAMWALGVVSLVITIPLSFGLYYRTATIPAWIAPAAALLGIAALIGVLWLTRRLWSMLAFLIGGAALSYWFVVSILQSHPEFQLDAIYTINRPATVLVVAGVISSKPLSGILWSAIGLVLGLTSILVAEWQVGLPLLTGAGPVIAFVNTAAICAAIALIQRAQRGRIPDFARSLVETGRLKEQRHARERAIALVHDTVLNDLSLVMTAPDRLSSEARDRLTADLRTLQARTDPRDGTSPETRRPDDPLENDFRNRLLRLLTNTRWSGLTVDTQLIVAPRVVLEPAVADAVLGAIGAAFDNVARHSGTRSAQLELTSDGDQVTFIVSDAGKGFDPDGLDHERLGVRVSIVGRIEAVGGIAKVWSTPGGGTSVIVTVPLRKEAS